MMTNLPSNTIFIWFPVGRKYFYYLLPPTNLTWLHRSESEQLKMHALLNWAIALSDVRTLFFDNSLIALRLHSFSFAQKIKDHSSLLSVRSIYKSDAPSSGVLNYCLVGATNIGSADYSVLTMRYCRNSMCWRVCSARTSRRYQLAAPTIPNCEGAVHFLFW